MCSRVPYNRVSIDSAIDEVLVKPTEEPASMTTPYRPKEVRLATSQIVR